MDVDRIQVLFPKKLTEQHAQERDGRSTHRDVELLSKERICRPAAEGDSTRKIGRGKEDLAIRSSNKLFYSSTPLFNFLDLRPPETAAPTAMQRT